MTTATATLPRTGAWTLDPSHSSVEFVAKHLVISKVRGRFEQVSGTVEVAEPVTASSVDIVIDAASITTNDEGRDEHLRGEDFLDAGSFPQLRFRSTGAHHVDDTRWTIPGELTIRDVTRTVELDVTYLGVQVDPWGNEKAGFAATTEIDREAFAITWNQALETGGVLVGNTVKVEIDVQFAAQA